MLEDGTIAVLDGHAGEVRTFAPDGSFIRRISRMGAGPGEISGNMTLALVGVGQMSFALPDVANQSVTVFSADGEVVATHRFDIEETYIPEWRPAGGSRPAVRIFSPASEVLALGSLDGSMSDTLAVVTRPPEPESMDRRVIYTFKAAGFGGRMWDAFSFGGEYLGALDLGGPADVYDIRGDTIVGVRENDVGLQQVFLARLPGQLGAER